GDPKATLPDITAAVRERLTGGARGAAPARVAAAASAVAARRDAPPPQTPPPPPATPVPPPPLLAAPAERPPQDAGRLEEALSSAPGIRQLIRSDDPQSYFGLRGGGIGWGLPATIGVKLALPERPVVGLIGDGSAMYTCQGLWTAARYRIDAVFVILNNTS